MKPIHWLWLAVTGFVVGLIARAILPGADSMGLIATTIVGILGSLLGGYVSGKVTKPAATTGKLTLASVLWSVAGAVVLLLIWRMIAASSGG
jgi:uncharacterized membrane protein YeaQ/YmgE (transglycosylase-associated protein family)